jgi:hypothetical protein
MVAIQNLKGEIIQLILSRKGGEGMYLSCEGPRTKQYSPSEGLGQNNIVLKMKGLGQN